MHRCIESFNVHPSHEDVMYYLGFCYTAEARLNLSAMQFVCLFILTFRPLKIVLVSSFSPFILRAQQKKQTITRNCLLC